MVPAHRVILVDAGRTIGVGRDELWSVRTGRPGRGLPPLLSRATRPLSAAASAPGLRRPPRSRRCGSAPPAPGWCRGSMTMTGVRKPFCGWRPRRSPGRILAGLPVRPASAAPGPGPILRLCAGCERTGAPPGRCAGWNGSPMNRRALRYASSVLPGRPGRCCAGSRRNGWRSACRCGSIMGDRRSAEIPLVLRD